MSEEKQGILGTTKGRLLVTAGVAAVALVGLSSVIDFPPGGSKTSGTIVPAERYRAPQNSAEDIKVGQPGTAQSSQTGAGIAAGNATANVVSPNAVPNATVNAAADAANAKINAKVNAAADAVNAKVNARPQ